MELLAIMVLCSSFLGVLALAALVTVICRRLRQREESVRGFLRGLWKERLGKFTCSRQQGRADKDFQEALCRLLVRASRWFLPFYVFRFGLIQYRYFMSIPHPTPAVLDLSDLVLYLFILLWSVFGCKLITPRSLDAWTTLVFMIGLLPMVLNSDPRFTSVIATRSLTLRMVCCLTAKHFWLSCILTCLHWLLVFYRINFGAVTDEPGMEVVAHVAVVLLAYVMREQIWTNTCIALELKSSTTSLYSVSRLLRGFCDVVVELDDSLTLCGDTSKLATMLLHGKGMSASQDNSRDFIGYFSPADREHIATQLRLDDGNSVPQALHATMLDSLTNALEVELLHIRFQDAEGRARRLVGVREFPDFAPVAPLADDVEMSRFPAARPVLLFDALSFEVLYVDSDVADTPGEPREGSSVVMLHQFLTYKELAQLQHVVNDCDFQNLQNKPVADLDFKLAWGRVRCVRFEHDVALSTWVGSLFLDIPANYLRGKAATKRSRKQSGSSGPSGLTGPLARSMPGRQVSKGSVNELRSISTVAL